MQAILVLNAGSSSLKFQIFGLDGGEPEMQVKGQIDGIGVRPHFRAVERSGKVLADRSLAASEAQGLPAATLTLRDWLQSIQGYTLKAIGHRVVHGGTEHLVQRMTAIRPSLPATPTATAVTARPPAGTQVPARRFPSPRA